MSIVETTAVDGDEGGSRRGGHRSRSVQGADICKHVQSTTGKGPSAGSAEGRASASTIAEGNQKGCQNVTMVARRAEGRASASTNVYRWKEPVLVEKQRKKNGKNPC